MSDIDNLRKALQGISSKLDQLNSSFWDKFLYINPSRKIIQRLLGLLNSPQIDGVLFDSQYKTLISKLNSLIEIEHLDESWTQFIQSINVLKQRVVNPAAQRKNLGFLSEIDFTTLDSFNQSKFSLEERADSWEIKGINGSLVYLLRALLPAKTQDEHAEHREANPNSFYIPSYPEFHSIISTLEKNKSNPQYQEQIEEIKQFLKRSAYKNWLMTLTRIRYNPKGDDIVIHNYKQQNQYEIPVNFLGPNEVILSADNAQKPMQTLLDTKQSLQEINDAYKWLTGVNAYILRLSSRPKKQDEKIARFYAYSNEAIFDCGRNPLDSNPALGVKFYPKGRTKLKIY